MKIWSKSSLGQKSKRTGTFLSFDKKMVKILNCWSNFDFPSVKKSKFSSLNVKKNGLVIMIVYRTFHIKLLFGGLFGEHSPLNVRHSGCFW